MVLLPIWSCFCLIRLVGSDIRTTVFFQTGHHCISDGISLAYLMAYPMAYPTSRCPCHSTLPEERSPFLASWSLNPVAHPWHEGVRMTMDDLHLDL